MRRLKERVQAAVRRVSKVEALRAIAVLMSGTVVAQLVGVAVYPLLTRLYTPAEFGEFAVFFSVLSIAAVGAALRYEVAIPIAEEPKQAASLLKLSVLIAGLISVLAGAASGAMIASGLISTSNWMVWVVLLPLSIITVCSHQALYNFALRDKRFRSIAGSAVARVGAGSVLQAGLFKLSGLGLVIGQLVGYLVGVLVLVRQGAVRAPALPAEVMQVARRFRSFPIYGLWGALFNAGGVHLPSLFFAYYFSAGSAGLYLLTHRVLQIPAVFIGAAVSDVYFSHAPDAARAGTLGPLTSAYFRRMIMLGAGPCLIGMLSGPAVFSLVFGPNWRMAGEVSSFLLPWIFIVFVTSPLMRLFVVFERNKTSSLVEAFLLLARMAALWGGYWISGADFKMTVLLYGVVSALVWLGILIVCLRLSSARLIDLAGSVGLSFLKGAVVAVPVGLAALGGAADLWILVAAIVGGTVYLAMVARDFRKEPGFGG